VLTGFGDGRPRSRDRWPAVVPLVCRPPDSSPYRDRCAAAWTCARAREVRASTNPSSPRLSGEGRLTHWEMGEVKPSQPTAKCRCGSSFTRATAETERGRGNSQRRYERGATCKESSGGRRERCPLTVRRTCPHPEQGRSASRRTHRNVRTMFVVYSVMIVGGIVFFVTVGFTQ
jgi:hypothetical protein